MKIQILMSTYNGERYVAEQIESIQRQTVQNWQLLVRDDGSTDHTCAIIDEFAQQDSRITLQRGVNVGVIASFHELVRSGDADFYFFADQDDIWLPRKLQTILAATEGRDHNVPTMYYTDLRVVDEQLGLLSESMIRSQSHHANTRLGQELTENSVTGCTSMINHALAELWIDDDDIIMHDWYLALLASAVGELVFVPEATILYRQHGNNVLGARTLRKRISNWKNPSKWFAKYWWLIISSQQQARKLLDENDDLVSSDDYRLLVDYVYVLDQPLTERWGIIRRHDLRKNRHLHTLVLRLLLLTKFAYPGRQQVT